MPDRDTIVAAATPPGRGGVGVVRVSGALVPQIAQAMVGSLPAPRRARLAQFVDAQGQVIDLGLALYFPAPASFTGEHVLELQGHGGAVVLELLVERAVQLGARRALPGEFSQRAYLNDKLDLAQAEAVADLIDAGSRAAARAAMRSLQGEFSRRVNALLDALVALRMYIEAAIDFPEEEIDFLSSQEVRERLDDVRQRMTAAQRDARQGVLLQQGLHVVIAGRPNAGKSSLLNRLAGYDAAIVTPIAGTTRDKVQQTIQIEGVPLHVIDTAGLRESSDEVERIGIARAWDEIAAADAVLFLHDLTRMGDNDYLAADAAIAETLAQKLPGQVPVIDVWNKTDRAEPAQLQAHGGREGSVALSARTGDGLDALRRRLLDVAGWQSAPEGLYLARARHVEALQAVAARLEEAELQLAAQAAHLDLLAEELRLAQVSLNSITGEFSSDDLLGVIFSSFCIGK